MLNELKVAALGFVIRMWMFSSGFHDTLKHRVEISTPLNSWERVVEGVHLHQQLTSPYEGDIFHETPVGLVFYSVLLRLDQISIFMIFVLGDIFAAFILARAAASFYCDMVGQQQLKNNLFHKDASSLILNAHHMTNVQYYVTILYMLNPYMICNCVAMTTTVFQNGVLALLLWAIAKRWRFFACLLIALATYQSFYPLVFVVPLAIATAGKGKILNSSSSCMVLSMAAFLSILWISTKITGNLKFLDATYGCILKVPDLTPNIGLFWYFFTEMFDHFHVFFTYVFQLNAFIYVLPLALRFHDNVPLLSFTLCALMAIFKSYPSIGDVGFCLALLPLWSHLTPFLRHSFIVGCMLLVTSVLNPILWHLWIYSGSANANFFFATTLAFATAQILLITDILFAQVKYEYHLKHGMDLKINGKEANLVLE